MGSGETVTARMMRTPAEVGEQSRQKLRPSIGLGREMSLLPINEETIRWQDDSMSPASKQKRYFKYYF